MKTVTLSPEDRIRDAEWWARELALDLPAGATPEPLRKARRRAQELRALHAQGKLGPETYTTEDAPF